MDPDRAPIAVARGLERRFGHVVALAGVDFAIGSGDVVLLAGPNGAGKSTLLRCIAGLIRPSRGNVSIGGRDLRNDPEARSLIGFLSHQTQLYDDLTARENLRFAARLHGLDAVDDRVRDALDTAGLLLRGDTRAGNLSHGMRQRLAIARATLHRPRLLLLDESFTGLDATAADLLRERIRADRDGGGAVVCVSHQPAEVWDVATRTMVMDRGGLMLDTPRPESLAGFVATLRRPRAA
ncbi:MAG: heme ABC exporter ATP-binding protein CcmA [Gemmatimonadales bacterium]